MHAMARVEQSLSIEALQTDIGLADCVDNHQVDTELERE